jgi:hypothetical protein
MGQGDQPVVGQIQEEHNNGVLGVFGASANPVLRRAVHSDGVDMDKMKRPMMWRVNIPEAQWKECNFSREIENASRNGREIDEGEPIVISTESPSADVFHYP